MIMFDNFLKIVAELGCLAIIIVEEVQAILILNSLPLSYDQLKYTLKCGNKTLSVRDVVSSAKSLEREITESREITTTTSTALIKLREASLSQRTKKIQILEI